MSSESRNTVVILLIVGLLLCCCVGGPVTIGVVGYLRFEHERQAQLEALRAAEQEAHVAREEALRQMLEAERQAPAP
ncbi:MAG: hypothetical protein SFU86_11155 [Pirellulaceae bacterium]|nr:hypothetical protein [Pirellulaceae bacterium]